MSIVQPGPDEIPRRFGMLTLLEYKGRGKNYHPMWLCRCDCGNTGEFSEHNMKAGRTTSCGCKKKPKFNEDLAVNLYVIERLRVDDVAERLNVSAEAVKKVLRKRRVIRSSAKTRSELYSGENSKCWRGGRSLDKSTGYIVLKRNGTNVYEHRIVAEKMLGRPLRPGEVVHHKNEIKTDNRPENLEVLPSNSDHIKLHMEKRRLQKMAALSALEGQADG